jgi:hypothetical protein
VTYATGAYPKRPDFADFNRDGFLDVAVPTSQEGRVTVLLGNGDGTLAPYKEYPAGGGGSESVETADMNNDGIPDIQVANSLNSVGVLLGNGDGTFQPAIVTSLPDDAKDIIVRDLNSDGLQDAAVINRTDHRVFILLGKGDGRLRLFTMVGTGPDPIMMDAGDFNNDGAVDLVVANQNLGSYGCFTLLLGNGDGTFQPKVEFPTGFAFANGISAADFDNDGNPDVVVSNSKDNTVSVFKGNGDGTFGAPVAVRVRLAPTGITVNDFNNDGFMDIAVSCQGPPPLPGAVSILLNSGNGGFILDSVHTMPLTFNVGSADLNGDGYAEVMPTIPGSNQLRVFLNDAAWPSPPGPISSASARGWLTLSHSTWPLTLGNSVRDVSMQKCMANPTRSRSASSTALDAANPPLPPSQNLRQMWPRLVATPILPTVESIALTPALIMSDQFRATPRHGAVRPSGNSSV